MPRQTSDVELWRAAREGDREAFGELIGRYQGPVCGVAYALTGSRAESEELAQDTFLCAWQRLHDLREPERLGAWLLGIARNLGRRAQSGRRSAPLRDDGPDAGPMLDDALAERRREALVWNTLAELPSKYREPLVLYYREGQSVSRVAESLGLTEATAKQRLSRGRKQLRRGVAASVEHTLASSRPGTEFRRRVSAVLPLAVVSPAPAKSPWGAYVARVGLATKSTKVVLAVVVALIASAAALQLRAPDKNSAAILPGPIAGDPAAARDPDPVASSVPAGARLASRVGTIEARARQREHPQEGRPLMLTRHGSRVTVNLGGGPSTIASFVTRGAPFTFDAARPEEDDALLGILIPPPEDRAHPMRTVIGAVTDAQGQPLPGALVLAGAEVTSERLPGREAFAVADEGAVTDVAGEFSIEIDAAKPGNALALNDNGWSQIEFILAGTNSVTLALQIAGRSRVLGVVRRGGQGIAALVSASPVEQAGAEFSVQASETGAYALALPPGSIAVRAAFGTANESKGVEQIVTVPAEGDVVVDFDLPVGTLVAVAAELHRSVGARRDDESAPSVCGVTLVAGHHTPLRPADADRVRGSLDPEASLFFTALSTDLDELLEEVWQFHETPPGAWTACVELEQFVVGVGLASVGFGCTQFTVATHQETVEVTPVLLPVAI